MCVCVCVCVCVRVRACACVCTYVYVCMTYVYMYVYVCVCDCVYVHIWLIHICIIVIHTHTYKHFSTLYNPLLTTLMPNTSHCSHLHWRTVLLVWSVHNTGGDDCKYEVHTVNYLIIHLIKISSFLLMKISQNAHI